MKRSLIGLLLAVSTLTACNSGPHAFFRNPDEQRAINAAYTQEVMEKQGIGGTSGSASGSVGGRGY